MDTLVNTLEDLCVNGRSIANYPLRCYDELFVTKRKKYEGRVATKINEWHLEEKPIIMFWEKDNPSRSTLCRVSDFKFYPGPSEAFDDLGDQLLPGLSRDEMVEFYYKTLGFEEAIKQHGFVAIKLEIILSEKN